VALVAAQRSWLLVLRPAVLLGASLLGVMVSTLAGLYPAWRAARLEPLVTLRLR
jgi:putative ABC transport system permease protein